MENDVSLAELTAEVVAAYVANNPVPATDMPDLIRSVHGALAQTSAGGNEPEQARNPAVSIRRSVTKDHIVCLEDGQKFKSLKRHLRTYHDMTPEEYRVKWGLPADYPMVAESYSERRAELAKKIGLGNSRKK